jgi:hypothetical protein
VVFRVLGKKIKIVTSPCGLSAFFDQKTADLLITSGINMVNIKLERQHVNEKMVYPFMDSC